MSPTSPVLHLLYGKSAAGKSALTAELGGQDGTIVIAEDTWLNALYADQIGMTPVFLRRTSQVPTITGAMFRGW